MTSKEIKAKFIKFFSAKGGSASGGEDTGHKVVPSSSLIPDDPSVLLTTAGMQQFVPYFLGEKSPYGDRVVTIQKCFRTSDIEEVGDDSHLTFFEMLGNFSFNNSYFKKEAIEWAYEFLTEELYIAHDRIYCSVFEGDEDIAFDKESYDILRSLEFSGDKIKKFGKEDNFWGPTGSEGPCGPTVEFYVDGLEVWNLVFNEYFCLKDKSLKPLEKKGVDTGMGFERLAMIMQNKKNVYEIDLFEPIIEKLKILSGRHPERSEGSPGYSSAKLQNDTDKFIRIIADHMRGSVFLIADGILPSNLWRGYILRRLLRRSIRYAKLLAFPENWYAEILKVIVGTYKEYYPELEKKEKEILDVIKIENEKFSKTLGRGLKELRENTESWIRSFRSLPFKGGFAFRLYDTYGFPPEMTLEELLKYSEVAERSNFIKEYWNHFKKRFNEHQEKSRAGLEKKFGGHGLIMDTGELKAGSEEDVKKVTELHTATHLLHQALRQVLGEHVKQMGSDINVDRLRFDFTHDKKLEPEEKEKIENLVNQKIEEDLEVKVEEMKYKDALESGALAFFKERYPEVVKVYSVGSFSKEVCGGPHVKRTGELGKFKVKKEESSSAGVRRIKAILE